MAGKRKVHTAAFKAQVALAALKGDRTVNELAGHYGVHPTLIHGWKKQLVTGAQSIFGSPSQAAGLPGDPEAGEAGDAVPVPSPHGRRSRRSRSRSRPGRRHEPLTHGRRGAFTADTRRRQAGDSKVPGLFAVPRHSGLRSGLAWASARRTPSAS